VHGDRVRQRLVVVHAAAGLADGVYTLRSATDLTSAAALTVSAGQRPQLDR